MMTTNHLAKIDPAIGQPGTIGSRPGRIDRVVAMGTLDDEGRLKVAQRILGDWPEWIEEMCVAGEQDTPAQFQERCGRLALELLYQTDDVAQRDDERLITPSALEESVERQTFAPLPR